MIIKYEINWYECNIIQTYKMKEVMSESMSELICEEE